MCVWVNVNEKIKLHKHVGSWINYHLFVLHTNLKINICNGIIGQISPLSVEAPGGRQAVITDDPFRENCIGTRK